ncbi:hypothetical protein B0T20DRAFT_493655 [Sordaria brevicollis]|uniref:Cerato-platanin n=1 Tax=Sordaria brevicollis TaxID=83679 RepID=A0AAE0UFH6_SORBR|nr:hypothetical protein B0T20DRAFT_493655 [Sordaria brevicollis]
MFGKNLLARLALVGTLALQASAVAIGGRSSVPDGIDVNKGHALMPAEGDFYITPHSSYSSSVGVLGCKVNVNNMAYWPEAIGCDDICIEVSYEGRKVTLFRVDNSVGAHDISFNAFNYLYTGYPATDKAHIEPPKDGGITAHYKTIDPNNCRQIINGTASGKLPFSAATSINYISNCVLNAPNSWVAKNFELWNIYDSQCNLGYNELCEIPDFKAGFNQAKCPHQLGLQDPLNGQEVWDIQYPSGDFKEAKRPGEP